MEIRLSDEFLAQYKGRQPKWGFDGLGYIVYLRTYARKKPDGTLEDWWETVRRFTEGNFKIEAKRLAELGKLTPERKAKLIAEMERFYHLAFNLVILPPGRGMWMSGTEYAERVGDAENNCWFVSMRPQPYEPGGEPKVSFAPVFTFDQAMKGGGVGVSIRSENVCQIPKVKNSVDLRFVCDSTHQDFEELRALKVANRQAWTLNARDPLLLREDRFIVPDSREGWAEALRWVIDAHYDGIESLVIDVSDVRPRGSEIKGFGGVASGPAPLVEMLAKVNEILNRRVGDYVTATEWGDIIQHIGCCVVAGNVRRTALILIGDPDDQEFIESKNYKLEKNKAASQWRWASNNSITITPNTPRRSLRKAAKNIYYNGEPGVVNLEVARNYGRIIDGYQEGIDGEVEGFNPCGEITLPNGSPCNLFEINLPRIHELIEKGIEGESLYEEACYLAARYAYRVTFRPYEWAVTRDVVERHRRLGVGITGITDWLLLAYNGDKESFTTALDRLYGYIRKANEEHARELEANPSIKVTTVKPSGTVSILMGVSPGQHYHWAPYMIRRVRMAINAPLVDVLLKCGYHVEPAIKGYDENGKPVYDNHTVVVEFPVKAPTAEHPQFRSAKDVSLQEQAELQALLQTYWSDNAVSATLTFKKPEPKPVFFEDGEMYRDRYGNPELRIDPREEDAVIEEITDILDRYKGVFKSTSLLPHATGTYAQMPYEEISKEQYEAMVARIKAKPWEVVGGGLKAEDESADDSMECVGGACPIR